MSIVGPDKYSRTELDGPEFLVTPGNARYWAVEVAADPELFSAVQQGAPVDRSRFFATWQGGRQLFGPMDATVFRLPRDTWNALSLNETLYYRLATSAQESRWDTVIVSTPGKIRLFGAFTKNAGDPIRPAEQLWRRSG